MEFAGLPQHPGKAQYGAAVQPSRECGSHRCVGYEVPVGGFENCFIEPLLGFIQGHSVVGGEPDPVILPGGRFPGGIQIDLDKVRTV